MTTEPLFRHCLFSRYRMLKSLARNLVHNRQNITDAFVALRLGLCLQTNEGFGGKRALGILRKIELCQKRSKLGTQFCFGVLNNVLHVFFPEACFLFETSRMQKNRFFGGHPLGTFC